MSVHIIGELIPGVDGPSGSEPPVQTDAHSAIRSARRRANLRDTFDLMLLIAVDALFVYWPTASIPLLDRQQSFAILVAAHVMIIGYVVLSRIFPRVHARRIAATWTQEERRRFTRQ